VHFLHTVEPKEKYQLGFNNNEIYGIRLIQFPHRTLFNQQNAAVPAEVRSLPLTPSRCISQHALSRRLSSFFVRNNVIKAEVKVAEPQNQAKWILLIVLVVVFIAIAIGLGVGL